MVYAQTRIRPGKWDAQTLLGFWDTNGSPNLGQTTRPYHNKKEKKKKEDNLPDCGFCCPGWPPNKTAQKWKEG